MMADQVGGGCFLASHIVSISFMHLKGVEPCVDSTFRSSPSSKSRYKPMSLHCSLMACSSLHKTRRRGRVCKHSVGVAGSIAVGDCGGSWGLESR